MNTLLNIVLVCPQIPQNTGNIGRICVCANSALHLIKPLAFDLDETKLKRAGLDYWPHLDLHLYESWEDFLKKCSPTKLFFSSTKTKKSYFDYTYEKGQYLIFGNETSGLPPSFYKNYEDDLYTIPMIGKYARSHNLANSVSIVMYEAIRQIGTWQNWV